MKTSFKLSALICAIVIIFSQSLYSQSCTQCDNTGNPPGTFASEIGQGTTASGSYSFAGGVNSTASGGVSFAFGSSALASDPYSISLGALTSAESSNAVALGSFSKASGTSSFVLGNGINSSNILENNIAYSMMIGFSSDKPTLFIGPSSGLGYTGSIGIGDVTDPLAKLHIKADDGEAATVFIEPFSFTAGESAKLRLGTMDYGISSGYGRLYFNTGGNYIFNSPDAYVGIGTLTPHEKLEVNGNIKQAIGAWLQTDEIKPAGESGLKLNDETGAGIIVKNGGKVGIGVPNPSSILDVDGTIATTGFQLSYGGGTDDGYDGYVLQADNLGNATWTDPMNLDVDDNDWAFGAGDDIYKMNGNVGIGNNSPSEALEVTGTVKATSFVGDGSGLTNIDIDDQDWAFGTGDDIFKLNGNVGIGTDDPDCKVHISSSAGNGDFEFFKVSNESVQFGGSTAIGKASGHGPVLVQQAGNI